MEKVFLTTKDGDILALDAITEVSKGRSNSLTNSSVMSGDNISDGYSIGNRNIPISGLVTYNKIGNLDANSFDPLEFQMELDRLVEDHTRFTLYGNELIASVKNCVIVSDEVIMDGFLDTIRVNLVVREVFTSQAATTDIVIVDPTKEAEAELAAAREADRAAGIGVKTNFGRLKAVAPVGVFTTTLF